MELVVLCSVDPSLFKSFLQGRPSGARRKSSGKRAANAARFFSPRRDPAGPDGEHFVPLY